MLLAPFAILCFCLAIYAILAIFFLDILHFLLRFVYTCMLLRPCCFCYFAILGHIN